MFFFVFFVYIVSFAHHSSMIRTDFCIFIQLPFRFGKEPHQNRNEEYQGCHQDHRGTGCRIGIIRYDETYRTADHREEDCQPLIRTDIVRDRARRRRWQNEHRVDDEDTDPLYRQRDDDCHEDSEHHLGFKRTCATASRQKRIDACHQKRME